jgi:hypothetical protein
VEGDERQLPWTGLTVGEARSRLAGWHFAKESLTDGEAAILYVAEGLLRLMDEEARNAAEWRQPELGEADEHRPAQADGGGRASGPE